MYMYVACPTDPYFTATNVQKNLLWLNERNTFEALNSSNNLYLMFYFVFELLSVSEIVSNLTFYI